MYLPKRISAIGNRPQKKVVYVSPLQGLIFHTACPGDAFSIVSQRAVAAFFLLPNNGDIDAAALKRHSTQPTLAASVRKVTLHREKERERKQKKSTKATDHPCQLALPCPVPPSSSPLARRDYATSTASTSIGHFVDRRDQRTSVPENFRPGFRFCRKAHVTGVYKARPTNGWKLPDRVNVKHGGGPSSAGLWCQLPGQQ
ncbi:uncharacterized protein LOC121593711 isoform X1 [Anopheles merus]|uniref:uncharacterized protein LOC121593711 isoform X1 n=1 Tax=Anopheles merus TaxID=30066 RepID=UPI001BE3DF0B|nr:uncharacterized protein LOC121593711 isoform X1 [Anopheles merus]